ncbi:MAG: hypothetical protein ACLP01_11590 [Solirubrobacteraceae bacterium]
MTGTQASNEEIVVAIALDVLAGKGFIADEPDDELVAALRRLYGAHQLWVQFTGEVLHDTLAARAGEYLAGFYEQERQEAWERTVPTWVCDCGQASKVLPGGIPGRPDDRFYRIVEDGLLGQLVGTIRGTGITHNKACPDCRREFVMTLKRHADPQLRLFAEA